MKRILLVLALMAVPTMARAEEQNTWRIRGLYLAAGVADIGVSEMAFATGQAAEGNVLLRNRGVRIVGILGMALAAAELDIHLGQKGNVQGQRICRSAYFGVSAVKVGVGLRFTWPARR